MKIRLFVLLTVAAGALPLERLAAQDVTVSEPQWFSTEPAPDMMPRPKRRLKPDYPDELRKTAELGYVMITRYLDTEGKSSLLGAMGTHIPFQRAAETEFRDWEMAAAKRGGQPVPALIWIAVIFNPKAATTKGADAGPRLLEVTPVVTKDRPVPAGQPPVIRMKLSIDANGAITSAQPEGEVKESTLAAIRAALKTWKFAPARAGGQPVAGEITVPVLCQRPISLDTARVAPPKVIKQVPPEYPLALRRNGQRGEVVLDFEVDIEGRVKNPVIVTSNNPLFNEPAIAALQKWTFKPSQKDGKPVSAKMRVPIVFALNGGGEDAFQVETKGKQNNLPENLRYDTPAKIIGVLTPVYPYGLLREEVGGKAVVMMLVGEQGKVIEVKIASADRPEFGLALKAAVEGFTFDPALKAGKPVAHVLNYEYVFDKFGMGDRMGNELLTLERKHPEKILGQGKLDAPLKPVSRRAPLPPRDWPAGLDAGEALIEVLVDREGHVRLPRIVSATADAFGYAAVQAVAVWQFEPPLAEGKPAVARVRVPFTFTTKKANAAAEKADAPKS